VKRISESEHNKIVKDAADYLNMKGYVDIKVDLTGYTQPTKITWTATGSGHIPDVTARNGHLYIFEVETDDSISHTHTEDQWKLFAAYANQHGAEFWVVVPGVSEVSARRRLNELNISAKVWGV
jgi:hypothetical protein